MYAAGIDIGTTTISILLLDPDKKTLIGRRTMEHNSFCEGDAAKQAGAYCLTPRVCFAAAPSVREPPAIQPPFSGTI